jgi:two-component system, NtrC family, sensor kinase
MSNFDGNLPAATQCDQAVAAGSEQSLSLEQQVVLLKQQLAQAEKLTALGELISTTTHEFNNVLMTIINYAKMGMRHQDKPTRDKSFEKILAAGNRAARITHGILGFARNRSAGQEPTDLAKLVDDVMLLLEREMQKYRVSIERQIADVPRALANSNQLQQVVLNLLVNARQAMPGGGQIVVRLSHDPAAGSVDLMIRDSGGGIPADKLPRIFDRFYTTKQGPDASGKGGTGLGLAFCRDVIEAHHGRIRVESTVGRGTAFTLKLPAYVPAATPPVTVNNAAHAPQNGSAVL